MFALAYRNLIDRTLAPGNANFTLTSPQTFSSKLPLSNLALRSRAAKARTASSLLSTLQLNYQTTSALSDVVDLIGVLGLVAPFGLLNFLRATVYLDGVQTKTVDYYPPSTPPYLLDTDSTTVLADLWIDLETPRTARIVRVDLAWRDAGGFSIPTQFTLDRLWIGPMYRAECDMEWSDDYIDPSRVAANDYGQAVPTISDNYLNAPRRVFRRRKLTLATLPFVAVYQPVPLVYPSIRPCLEDVLVHLGSTRNCVSFVRDGPLFDKTADRLAICGRQTLNPITITHQGGDHYSLNLEFTEEV